MLEILGTIGGNILSLPGILGLAIGMMTRNVGLAAILGGVIGIFETLILTGFDFSKVEILDLSIAICVGIAAGLMGSGIRRIGASV